MLVRRRRLGRLVLRTANQVAMSILATLAATTIYGSLWHSAGVPEATPVPPAVTSGGKLAARIDGAARDTPAPSPPLTSLASWTVLTAPLALVDDPDWVAHRAPASPVTKPSRPAPEARRALADGETAAVARPAVVPRVDVRPPSAVVVADTGRPLWAEASAAVSTATATAASAVGTATATAAAALHGIVAFGGALTAHVMP